MHRSRSVLVIAAALAVASCGGGDDDVGEFFDAAGASEQDGSDDSDVFEGVGDAAESANQTNIVDGTSASAEPGTAWVETDGQRFDYSMAGSINLRCEVSRESVQINMQTPEGYDLSIVMTDTGDFSTGSITFGGSDGNVDYGADLLSGTFGVGDNAVSYDGPITKVVDYDITNATEIDGTIAVNCEPAGGNPTATVGDVDYEFPINGAQSLECVVEPEFFEVRVNRLAADGLQLEMQGRYEGDQWIGAVVVYTPDGNSVAPLPLDGSGLTIDGTAVTFDGTFDTPDGSQLTGTATATCG